jgi:uncharacterized protein
MAKKRAAKKTAKKKTVSPKKAAKTSRAAAKKSAPKRSAARAAAPKKKGTPHPIIHWEIQSQRPEILHQFYRDAFGWEVDANNPMNYGMVASAGGDGGINGGIGGSPSGGSRVTVYASVPSIESALARIVSLGGQVIMPRTDVGPVIMGLYHDPEGNLMGLVEG